MNLQTTAMPEQGARGIYRLSLEYSGMEVWQNPDRCGTCGRTTNRANATLAQDKPPVRSFPLSLTSDGFFVCSMRFRRLAEDCGFEGIEFIPLANRYNVLKVSRKVQYAPDESIYQKQDGWCEACQTFAKSLIGMDRATVLAKGNPIGPKEIVESELRFGTELLPSSIGWTSLHADLIVGSEVGSALAKAKLKGLRVTDQPIDL